MGARTNSADRLLVKASYGLEIAFLAGLSLLVLVAHNPDRPGAGLLLVSGLVLLGVGAGALLALRGTELAKVIFRYATRRFRTLPRA